MQALPEERVLARPLVALREVNAHDEVGGLEARLSQRRLDLIQVVIIVGNERELLAVSPVRGIRILGILRCWNSGGLRRLPTGLGRVAA